MLTNSVCPSGLNAKSEIFVGCVRNGFSQLPEGTAQSCTEPLWVPRASVLLSGLNLTAETEIIDLSTLKLVTIDQSAVSYSSTKVASPPGTIAAYLPSG